MRKFHTKTLVGGLAIGLAATLGVTSAHADAPTLVLSGGAGIMDMGPVAIKATASVQGTVAFSAAGKIIPGCESVGTAAAAPFVATCQWTPGAAGATALTGVLTPSDATIAAVNSPTLTVKVALPVQGVAPSPISLYVDTVLASGATGPLAPAFGTGCAITSEFIVGQTIVWRIYGNNAALGGAVLTPKNVASATITVPGVATPITLNYGNHSGVAFWTGVLKTGDAAGLYNTLGVINFKVTFVAKDMSTTQVLATKRAAVMKDGKKVRDASGKIVYENVSYWKTIKVSPVIKGAVGTWQSNFMAGSQVTLNALPKA